MQPELRTTDVDQFDVQEAFLPLPLGPRTHSFGTGAQLGVYSSLSSLSALLRKDILLLFFSLNFCLSIWIPSGSNKPRTGSWVCAFRINIPMLILTNSTLFFPSKTAVRWVMLSILFPTVLSGSRIKDSSLLEQKSYLFLKKVSHHYVALQHGLAHGDRWNENH